MTAIKAADVDHFIAKPDQARPIVLIYGPDVGLVRERAEALVRAAVDDPGDPFAFARIDSDELAGNPSRLVEEAHTVPLFGGRRAVLVKAGTRNIAAAVELVIAAPSPECRVIIEAGDLRKNAPLRVLCEKARTAAVLPCYIDDKVALARLVDDEMRAANLRIAPDARTLLLSLLGGDRLASRSEIRKLTLYGRGQERLELADVIAVVADASALAVDGVIDAAFAGKIAEFDCEFIKARAGGSSPAAIISAAIRQVANLHKMRLAFEFGRLSGVRHETRDPASTFHPREIGGRRIADTERGWPVPRDAAACGGFPRNAPQPRAGRSHRTADAVVHYRQTAAFKNFKLGQEFHQLNRSCDLSSSYMTASMLPGTWLLRRHYVAAQQETDSLVGT